MCTRVTAMQQAYNWDLELAHSLFLHPSSTPCVNTHLLDSATAAVLFSPATRYSGTSTGPPPMPAPAGHLVVPVSHGHLRKTQDMY
jgi:hypothetical protein